MPTYVYKFIDTGETIEVQQAFDDDTLTEHPHPESGDVLAVKKVFQPVGVTFKGSGFFKTDQRGSKTASKAPASGESSSSNTSSTSDSSSSDSSSSKTSTPAASTSSTSTSTSTSD